MVLEYDEHAPFPGLIGRTLADSVPAWPAPLRARPGSPNVVYVLLDDVGFAQFGCYGSDIDTPTFDRLADGGLRYSRFHTTAMCSPTRASLLTGCNHHTTGMGGIADQATGFPGYHGMIGKETGFLSEILRQEGYATLAVGKWHLAPREEIGLGSSRARWPLGRGFDRFYGFLGAETNQYDPDLVHDSHWVTAPRSAEDGYHLTEDLVDHAIEFVNDLRNTEPDKPFFLYLAPGACHAPHQAPVEWIERYKGRFDQGWDAWRSATLTRQIDTGILPAGTVLTDRPEFIPAWTDVPEDERALSARMMEVFAAFLSHTDHHIGRLVDHLTEIGELDNTIICVLSDNGASPEGGIHGSWNTNCFYNGERETFALSAPHLEELGGPLAYGHYPTGWAHAGNTPFKKWKRETHEGGVADPLIIHYPRAIRSGGEVRRQYAHVIDLTPTVLDLIGISAPPVIDGVPQRPMAGRSLVPTLAAGDAPEVRATQYYELLGCRAIYHHGWKALAYRPFPGHRYDPSVDYGRSAEDDPWELYHVDEDPSESNDLALVEPDRLARMIELWFAEAGRYSALPVHSERGIYVERPRVSAARERHVYRPGAAVSNSLAVDVRMRSHRFVADVSVPDGAEGVLAAHGGRFGGYAWFAQGGRIHYHYNLYGSEQTRVTSDFPLTPGRHRLAFVFDTPGGPGAPATVRLFIGPDQVGEGTIPRIINHTYILFGDGLCIGHDDATPVTESYRSPFPFTGTIHRVVVDTSGDSFADPARDLEAILRSQ